MKLRILAPAALTVLALTAVITPVSLPAQPYPSRHITLVVPFAPGGPADFLGRIIGQKLSEELGQQVIIDNRPGANTIIGAQTVARANPDGYTLLLAIDGTPVMNPYDWVIDADKGEDFVFTMTGRGPLRGWSKYKRGWIGR